MVNPLVVAFTPQKTAYTLNYGANLFHIFRNSEVFITPN